MTGQEIAKALTLGDVAEALGCESWRIRRLFTRGILPEPSRVGPYRVFADDDLPAIRDAAERAGYLRQRAAVPA